MDELNLDGGAAKTHHVIRALGSVDARNRLKQPLAAQALQPGIANVCFVPYNAAVLLGLPDRHVAHVHVAEHVKEAIPEGHTALAKVVLRASSSALHRWHRAGAIDTE
eukprot:6308164-Alexandrium_andersonii.AAC.1